MTKQIQNNEFEENRDLVFTQQQEDQYTVDNGDTINVYVLFSATTVCSVAVSYADEYRACATPKIVRLTNERNPQNLYALQMTLDKENETERRIQVKTTINGCSGVVSKTIISLITQKTCECAVTYYWGNFDEPVTRKYYVGDTISSQDKNHTVTEIERAGYTWDGEFYYKMPRTPNDSWEKVYFNHDIVRGYTSVFANIYKRLVFNVIDARTRAIIEGATITINGRQQELFASHDEQYKYAINAPCNSDDEQFEVVVSANNYISGRSQRTYINLNKGDILLEKEMEPNEFTITLKWDVVPKWSNPTPDDMDSHLVICDADGTQKAHLHYNSGKISDNSNIKSEIECDGLRYELDFDDVSGVKDYTEHVHGWIKEDSDNIYRFFVKDYTFSSGHRMYDWNTRVKLCWGNKFYPQSVTGEEYYRVRDMVSAGDDEKNRKYWIVFDIKKDKSSGRWQVVTGSDKYKCNGQLIDAYGNTTPYAGG